jgi:pyruvate dehydrogenase E1 component alpha subunit
MSAVAVDAGLQKLAGASLRYMTLMREAEERIERKLYRQGKIVGGVYVGRGQEAIPVGAGLAVGPDDVVCPSHRDLAIFLMRGVTPGEIFAQYMGRLGGLTRGRDGNMHMGDMRRNIVAIISAMAASVPVAAGCALALKYKGTSNVAVVFFGDGATSRGDWHEGVNFAAVQKLPLVLVCNNNQYAYSTPLDKQFAVDPVERAEAYGFVGVKVDGNDVEAMFEATRAARERALAGGGPTLIEAVTMRMHGHAAHDDMKYVPSELVEEWRRRDPVDRQESRLRELGVDVDGLRASVAAEIDRASEEALASPMPDPSTATDGLFCEGEAEVLGDGVAPWSGFQS